MYKEGENFSQISVELPEGFLRAALLTGTLLLSACTPKEPIRQPNLVVPTPTLAPTLGPLPLDRVTPGVGIIAPKNLVDEAGRQRGHSILVVTNPIKGEGRYLVQLAPGGISGKPNIFTDTRLIPNFPFLVDFDATNLPRFVVTSGLSNYGNSPTELKAAVINVSQPELPHTFESHFSNFSFTRFIWDSQDISKESIRNLH
jgi:hypothetical protein